ESLSRAVAGDCLPAAFRESRGDNSRSGDGVVSWPETGPARGRPGQQQRTIARRGAIGGESRGSEGFGGENRRGDGADARTIEKNERRGNRLAACSDPRHRRLERRNAPHFSAGPPRRAPGDG